MDKQSKATAATDEYITAREYAELSAEERKAWVALNPRDEKIPLAAKIAFCILGVCAIIYVVAIFSEPFANFFTKYVGSFFRMLLAKITGIIPFSLAELLIISLIPIAVIFIRYAFRSRSFTWKSTLSVLSVPLSVLAVVLSLFVVCLGTSYRTSTLDKRLGFEMGSVSTQDLCNTAELLAENINALSAELDHDSDRFSIMPYSIRQMNDKLLDAYDSFCEKHNFIFTFDSRLKPVMLSRGLSYAHITGIYTFFTGEANINIDFPDYTTPFTAAHELAHQRGIAREDEANMMAFLVCMESDDTYIRYSAYLSVYEYVSSALYSTDKDAFQKVYGMLSPKVVAEQLAYNRFFDKFADSSLSKVSATVNDAYLQTQGTAGRISYNMVVELTVAYLKNEGMIP